LRGSPETYETPTPLPPGRELSNQDSVVQLGTRGGQSLLVADTLLQRLAKGFIAKTPLLSRLFLVTHKNSLLPRPTKVAGGVSGGGYSGGAGGGEFFGEYEAQSAHQLRLLAEA
jgi:hypothetical protein